MKNTKYTAMFKFRNRSKWLLAIAGICLLISVIAVFFPHNTLDNITLGTYVLKVGDYDKLAQFISGITAPFLSICTIILVYETYRAQKDELEETRKEFAKQNETMQLQRFENTLFQMLRSQEDIVSKFTKASGLLVAPVQNGREVVEQAARELKSFITNNSRATDETVAKIFSEHFYNDFYRVWESTFNHYFRHLFYIFKVIYFSEILTKSQKKFYADLVSAQLSQDDFLLLSCNAMLQGYGYPKFTYLIREYDLLRNFREDQGLRNPVFERFIANTISTIEYPFADMQKPTERNIE